MNKIYHKKQDPVLIEEIKEDKNSSSINNSKERTRVRNHSLPPQQKTTNVIPLFVTGTPTPLICQTITIYGYSIPLIHLKEYADQHEWKEYTFFEELYKKNKIITPDEAKKMDTITKHLKEDIINQSRTFLTSECPIGFYLVMDQQDIKISKVLLYDHVNKSTQLLGSSFACNQLPLYHDKNSLIQNVLKSWVKDPIVLEMVNKPCVITLTALLPSQTNGPQL
jgi:hypothetical protein